MKRVLVPLAQGCEELEAVTVIDLLRRAGIEVTTAGLDSRREVTCSRGTVLVPDQILENVLEKEFDMIVLPGGLPGADYLDKDERIKSTLQKMASKGKYTAAICAAPKVLANAGLLKGKNATGYPGALDKSDIQETNLTAESVVVDGSVITSKGPGTAMDFALTLIEKLVGEDTRNQVEAALQRPQ